MADALRHLPATEHTFDVDQVRKLVADAASIPAPTDVHVEAPPLCEFDFFPARDDANSSIC